MFGITKEKAVWGVVGALGTGLVALLVALATGYFQSREPVLQFIRNESPPLRDKDKATSIYFASVYNVGNKEAEDVDCVVQIPKGRILSHGFTPHHINYTYKEDGGTATIHVATLNPKESITVQFLATSDTELPLKPDVAVRAKGFTGVEKGAPTTQQNDSFWQPTTSILSASMAILLIPVLFGIMVVLFDIPEMIKKRWDTKRKRFKIKVKIDEEVRIRVTILEGLGKSSDAVVILPMKSHQIIGYSFEELKTLGDGTHVIHKER